MLLYDIVLPSGSLDNAELLYYRTDRGQLKTGSGERCISLNQGECVSFDTYLNLFSYTKFLRYTRVNKIRAQMNFKGKIAVFLVRNRSWLNLREDFSSEVVEKTLAASEEKGAVSLEWDFSAEQEKDSGLDRWTSHGKIQSDESVTVAGFCFLRVVALEDGTEIYGGSYYADDVEAAEVKVGIGICTFHREEYVERNLRLFRRMMDEYDFLRKEIEVYVVDNGKSLDSDLKLADNMHILPNLNYGGSGGFTRALMEVWYRRADFTHVLLMDDDIILEPTAILKTLAVLRTRKPEYEKARVGGAFLHISNPYFQFEQGPRWVNGAMKSQNRHTVSIVKNLLENEKMKKTDIDPWYFCCMPVSYIEDHGFPFPLFIKGDDIEYSLRDKTPIILMNGIGVWHESFLSKFSSHLTYFDCRNKLVVRTLTMQRYTAKRAMKFLVDRTKDCIYRQRYDEAEFILLAMEDYLQGVDYFLTQNEEEKLKQLLQMRTSFFYSREELEEQGYSFNQVEYASRQKYTRNKLYQLADKLTLNGNLLPSFLYNSRMQYVNFGEENARYFCRWKHIYQWSPDRDKGMVTHDEPHRKRKLLFRLLRDMILTRLRFAKVSESYLVRANEITSLSFWEKHLQLPETTDREDSGDVGFRSSMRRRTKSEQKEFKSIRRKDHCDILYGNFYTSVYRLFKDSFLGRDRAALRTFKGIHTGKRCFIVATGPSLCLEDIDALRGEYTFGVNSIFNLFEMTDWRPTYYVMCDASGYRRMEKTWDFENYCTDTAFLNRRIIQYGRLHSEKIVGFVFNHSTSEHYAPPSIPMCFEREIDICIYDRCTVTNAAIDIALYMGFQEIYLLGVDHDYTGVRHFVATEDDVKRRPPTLAHMRLSESGYEKSKENAEAHGAVVYNATRGGKLEIFERRRPWEDQFTEKECDEDKETVGNP